MIGLLGTLPGQLLVLIVGAWLPQDNPYSVTVALTVIGVAGDRDAIVAAAGTSARAVVQILVAVLA